MRNYTRIVTKRWGPMGPNVNITYHPRFTQAERTKGVRKTVYMQAWDNKGAIEAEIKGVTHDEAYEAAKNLRLIYIMQHNLG